MESTVKHAVLADPDGGNGSGKHVEAELGGGRKVCLAEQNYTQQELDAFNAEKDNWIIQRAGTRQFLAEHDSGEDAVGYYCGYFDLEPQNAIFDQEKLVGYYLCPGDLHYYGNDRASFDIYRWGYPGSDPFASRSSGAVIAFLFGDPETHCGEEFSLLKRDPEKEYQSYISF